MPRMIQALIAAVALAMFCGCPALSAEDFQLELDSGAAQHLSKLTIREWLRRSYQAVRHYYGQFPMKELLITIHDEGGDSVGFGSTTWENGHGSIEINIGRDASETEILHSWTATHEMTHLAMPILPHADRWVAEGMATYIEPIARLQLGQLTREEVWSDFVRNGPRALPRNGRGFRNVRNFGEMYWGGAVWCLLADIQIREKTNNRVGFEDAMRAIVKAHATADSDYSTEQALRFGDEGVGVAVLVPMYKQFSDGPIDLRLDDLWRRLGIIPTGRTVRLDDSAPLAYVRRSIEAGSK